MRPSASTSSSTLELDHLDYHSASYVVRRLLVLFCILTTVIRRAESRTFLGDEEKEKEWNADDLYDGWQSEKDETRSLTTAHDEPSPQRPSRRLMVVHFLHGMLLLISIFTLLISFWRWEHKVEVDTNNVIFSRRVY